MACSRMLLTPSADPKALNEVWPYGLSLVWALYVVIHDLRRHQIQDAALWFASAAVALCFLSLGHGPFQQGLAATLIGALAGLLLASPAALMGYWGGGDVKLCAVIGALLGPVAGAGAAVVAALLLGLQSVALIALRRRQQKFAAAPALLSGFAAVIVASWVGNA